MAHHHQQLLNGVPNGQGRSSHLPIDGYSSHLLGQRQPPSTIDSIHTDLDGLIGRLKTKEQELQEAHGNVVNSTAMSHRKQNKAGMNEASRVDVYNQEGLRLSDAGAA